MYNSITSYMYNKYNKFNDSKMGWDSKSRIEVRR